ncbi:ATP-dependent DNA helicase pfh1 [Purpureocillium lavendulum]|uniref:ATP-dependent DNA helicase pfh1 n=1 Tax=Purpureocillium lavendulum TaxID=1247861 RepID=A0AB34FAE5_9HYPO|nr:ATP-dependent DNA helicase pfh1 [Purpureocillium lavendulum]
MDLSQLPRDLATAVGQYLGQTQAEVSSPPQATLPPSAQAAAVEDFRDTVSISESEEADAGPPRIDKRKILTQRRLDQLAAARAAKKSKGSLATRQESRHLDQARPDTDAPSNCRTTATFGRTQETQQELGEIQEQLRQQTERTQRQGEQIQQLLDAILAASGNRNARQRRRSGSPESSPCPRERIRERSPAYEPKNKNQVQIQQFRGNSAAELSTFLGTLQWVFREHPSHYRSEQRRIRLAAGHLSQTLRRDFLDNLHLKYDGSEENMSWGDMEDWLWSNINNPRGRTRTAYASLTQLKQKPTQSFRDFFRQYRTIESEFPHTVPDWLRIEMFLFCCKKSIRDLFRSQNYPQSWNDLVEKGYEYDDDVHEKQRHHDPTRGSSAMGTADAPNPIASNVVKAGIPQPGTLAQLAQLQVQTRFAESNRTTKGNRDRTGSCPSAAKLVPYQLRQDGRWLKTQMALLDQGSAYNLISPRLLTQRDWERVETTSEQPETADHTKIETRGTIHILLKATDSWGTEKIVMPFGLVNAPASFQQYINDALEGLVDITCVVYLDDILIFSENAEQHEDDAKECEFSVREVSFLGFVVDQEGIHMERERVCAIAQWPVPRSVKDVQVFLGFTGFYRRFIKNYSKIVSPLSDCLRKKAPGPSILGPKAMQAFECLKTAFQNGPILKHF